MRIPHLQRGSKQKNLGPQMLVVFLRDKQNKEVKSPEKASKMAMTILVMKLL